MDANTDRTLAKGGSHSNTSGRKHQQQQLLGAMCQRRAPSTSAGGGAGKKHSSARAGIKRVSTLKLLPSRLLSRIYGSVNRLPLPTSARPLVYGTWAWFFRVKLEEVPRPLIEYEHLTAFFTRRLREGCRPVHPTALLVSPVDGRVVSVSADLGRDGTLAQVKSIAYHITDFLGIPVPQVKPGHALFSAVLYLSPGDYHRCVRLSGQAPGTAGGDTGARRTGRLPAPSLHTTHTSQPDPLHLSSSLPPLLLAGSTPPPSGPRTAARTSRGSCCP